MQETPVQIEAGQAVLNGDLYVPQKATGIVLFAHGSGSTRQSPRNQYVARALNKAGLATLLFDLLTLEEEAEDLIKGTFRFNIPFLTERLIAATDWTAAYAATANLKIGYFGASTGAAAALAAASKRQELVNAVVSRGGRPDMAGKALGLVKAPTLLIVGGHDYQVIDMNKEALAKLSTIKELVIVPGATHLFEEPGTLEEVARLAAAWFGKYLAQR